MNIVNAIKLVCTNVDYDLDGISEEARDALEDASMVLQEAFNFDTNKVKIDLLDWEERYKRYTK